MHPNVYSSAINNRQNIERAQISSTDEWIKKMWFIYTMEDYSAIEKNEISPFATMWSFLKKLKIELLYNPPIALLGIYPKGTKMLIRRGTCTPMFIAVLPTLAK